MTTTAPADGVVRTAPRPPVRIRRTHTTAAVAVTSMQAGTPGTDPDRVIVLIQGKGRIVINQAALPALIAQLTTHLDKGEH